MLILEVCLHLFGLGLSWIGDLQCHVFIRITFFSLGSLLIRMFLQLSILLFSVKFRIHGPKILCLSSIKGQTAIVIPVNGTCADIIKGPFEIGLVWLLLPVIVNR